MPVPLLHLIHAVGGARAAAGLQQARIRAQPHRAAHIRQRVLIRHERDDGVARFGREFLAVRLVAVEDVPRQLHAHHLHPQTQPQIRDAVFAGVARREDLPLDAAIAEAARHYDAIGVRQLLALLPVLQSLTVNPINVDIVAEFERGMDQRLAHADVGVLQLHVLAHERDAHDGLLAL